MRWVAAAAFAAGTVAVGVAVPARRDPTIVFAAAIGTRLPAELRAHRRALRLAVNSWTRLSRARGRTQARPTTRRTNIHDWIRGW